MRLPTTCRTKRPVILTFVAHYLPGFRSGGPVRSISNLVDNLGDEIDFRIVTRDRDLGDAGPFAGIEPECWTKVGKANVFYASPNWFTFGNVARLIRNTDHDLVYLNSLFEPCTTLLPLVVRRMGLAPACPYIIAPRGELSLGALALKPQKKRLFLGLAKVAGLYRDANFQASSEHEAADIRRVFGIDQITIASALARPRISIASDLGGPAIHSSEDLDRARDKSLKIVFLSRISPKKNLLGALDILAAVSLPLVFDIYGVVEDAAYWELCEDRIASLPPRIIVRYRGELLPSKVEEVLSGYDLFFFPTLGENYGHVIREALSAGLPVLVSDQTPWRGLEVKGVGADISLDESDAFVRWIEAFDQLNAEERRSMRQQARLFGDDPVVAAANLEANRSMFHDVIFRHSTLG